MTRESQEAAVLERVREELLAEGYDVVLQPNKLMVPPFLGNVTPDALAFGPDKNLVIEVAAQTPATEIRVRQLSELVHVTPQEAESLRGLVSVRNRFIHGDLNVEVPCKRVAEMSLILRSLLERETGKAL